MDNRAAATLAVRQRIVEAALDELAAAPQGAITLADVATRADLALRTLYNHFPSRDELLTAAFLHHGSLSRAAIEAVSVPDATPEEQLRHLIGAYYGRYADMGPRLTALLGLRGFPALAEQVRAIRNWRRHVLGAVIANAREQDLLAASEATALALAFTVTSHAHWHVLVSELHHEDPATVTANALCKAILHAGS
jgi:AcrR family transcriptional regulator